MSEPNTNLPSKAREPRSDAHKSSSMSQRPSSSSNNTTSSPGRGGQPQKYDIKPQSSFQPQGVIPEYTQSNTNPQTPAKHRRQKLPQSAHDHQPHGKSISSTTKKRSALRHVSQSGDELAPSNIHNMDGTGYHSADATSAINHATTPARQAYAGPTFHASPAASTLPIPKNFAKSLPADTPKSRLQARVEKEAAVEDARYQSPSPRTSQLIPPRSEQDSPIDFLLNAHRAQQGKSTDRGSNNGRPVSWNDEARLRRPESSSNTPHPRVPGTPGSMSNKEMFMMEVDGANEELEAEDSSNVVPFRHRMSDLQASPDTQLDRAHTETEEKQRLAKSKALKNLLFAASDQPPRASSHAEAPHQPTHFAQSPYYNPNDPFQQSRPVSERSYNQALLGPEQDPQIRFSSQTRLQSGPQIGQKYADVPPSLSYKSEGVNEYGHEHNWNPPTYHGYPNSRQLPQRESHPSQQASAGTGSDLGGSGQEAQTRRSDQDVVAMEDSLRRMLKLEKADGNSGPTAH